MVTRSPVADAKSLKNDTELEGFRQCHIRDGVALVCDYYVYVTQLSHAPVVARLDILPGWKQNLRKDQLFLRAKQQVN